MKSASLQCGPSQGTLTCAEDLCSISNILSQPARCEKYKVHPEPVTTAVLPDFCRPCTWINKHHCGVLFLWIKTPQKWLQFITSGLGTLHWPPQKCTIIFYRRGCSTESGFHHIQNWHHWEYEDAKKLPASCPKNEVCKEATQSFSNWHPQAQLVTAESSSLFSMQSTSECLFLKKRGEGKAQTRREHTQNFQRKNKMYPAQLRMKTPAAN